MSLLCSFKHSSTFKNKLYAYLQNLKVNRREIKGCSFSSLLKNELKCSEELKHINSVLKAEQSTQKSSKTDE